MKLQACFFGLSLLVAPALANVSSGISTLEIYNQPSSYSGDINEKTVMDSWNSKLHSDSVFVRTWDGAILQCGFLLNNPVCELVYLDKTIKNIYNREKMNNG